MRSLVWPRDEGLVSMIGAVACLLAAPQVQLCDSSVNGWPHNTLLYHYSSGQSAATWDIVKRCC